MGKALGGAEVWVGEETGDECVSACVERKEKGDDINGVMVYASSRPGCWCWGNMTKVRTGNTEYKSCFLSSIGET